MRAFLAVEPSGEALGELKHGVLDLAGMGDVDELLIDVGIRERAAEPGGLPEQEGHEDEKKRQGEDQKEPATRDAGSGRGW